MSEPLARIQAVLQELAKAVSQVDALLGMTDADIDKMIEAGAGAPTASAALQATANADAAAYAQLIQTLQADLSQAADSWSAWLDAQTQRILSFAAETPTVTSPQHKVVQQVVTVKPPPAVPAPLYDALLSIAEVLYYTIMAGLSGEVAMKPADVDRYIDTFIKIVEVASKVARGG